MLNRELLPTGSFNWKNYDDLPNSELEKLCVKYTIRATNYESKGSTEEAVPNSGVHIGSNPIYISDFKYCKKYENRIRVEIHGNFSDYGVFFSTVGCSNKSQAYNVYNSNYPTTPSTPTASSSFPYVKYGVPYKSGAHYNDITTDLVNTGLMKNLYTTPGDDRDGNMIMSYYDYGFKPEDFIVCMGVTIRSGSGRRNAGVTLWCVNV